MSIVTLKNVHKRYPLGKTEVHAVKDVSFEIGEGDFNLVPLLLGKGVLPKAERKTWIDELIEEVGLSQWRTHKPNELSGGQITENKRRSA